MRSIIKHYCTSCERDKPVFVLGIKGEKRCPECGKRLDKRKVEV